MDSLFQDVRLEILSCKTIRLKSSPGLRPTTPYWRLHWSDSSKSRIFFGDSELFLGADKMLVVPPGVEISRELQTPSNHFFSHFTLLNQGRRKLKQAYVFPMASQRQEELRKLWTMAKNSKWTYPQSIRLNAFILAFLSGIPEEDWVGKKADSRISKIISIIEKAPAVPHSNRELAREIGMSANAFIRFFKQHTGMAPLSYQIKQRIEKAMIQLEHTEKTIEEIAEECGFCDRNYFSKTFKEQTGTPPAQYRKEAIE